MTTRKLGRLAAAAVLSAAAAGGTLALAGPASAEGLPPPQCQLSHGIEYQTYGPRIIAYDVLYCPPGAGTSKFYPVSVSREESGKWVILASGTGTATYVCNGDTENTYMGGGGQINAPCG